MSLVKGNRNKSTEVFFIGLLRARKMIGWRRKQSLFGSPDFVFRSARTAVFIDGCFWHGCKKCYRRPNSNQKYWDVKIARNRERDKVVNKTLKKRAWKVVRIWEHDLRNQKRTKLLDDLQATLSAAK